MRVEDDDLMSGLEKLDRWLHDGEGGEVPLAVLRAGGMEIPNEDAALDDGALHAKLWEILEGMAGVGMFIDSTDHLSDRELYRHLVQHALAEETLLDPHGICQISPIGGCSEEDNEIYLRYYADDETRERWCRDFELTLPPRETPPYDRDRLLPDGELRLLGLAQ